MLAVLVHDVRGGRLAVAGCNAVGLATLMMTAGSALLAGPLIVPFAAETSTQLVAWLPPAPVPVLLVPVSAGLQLYSVTNLYLGGRGAGGRRAASGLPRARRRRS